MGRPSRLTVGRVASQQSGRAFRLIIIGLGLALTASCTGVAPHLESRGPGETPAPPAAQLSYTQQNNDVISPSNLVAVAISNGRLDNVALVEAGGAEVPGTFDPGMRLWKNARQLSYGRGYLLAVTGTGDNGQPVQDTRAFSTLKPGNYAGARIRAFRGYGPDLDGGTFGVGQPIVVEFDRNVADRAAAQQALLVTTDPPTIGAWRWVNDDEVHWRPKEYWKSGTKVTVTANLFGTNLGNGVFGRQNRTASFTIGPSKIAIADHDTKRMHIYIDGVDITSTLAQTWSPSIYGPAYDHSGGAKISMGREGAYSTRGWFDMRTSSGPHVVMEKAKLVRMRSSLPKSDPLYYEQNVPYAVRITASGEYVHWADWSVYDQGVRNVSHGCINMSPNDAVWFYNNFGYGDIVDVHNTGKTMGLTDGLGDWNLPWEQWVQA
jgi:lipoprotein-anchoring transpeptidase ErfK/SrfK